MKAESYFCICSYRILFKPYLRCQTTYFSAKSRHSDNQDSSSSESEPQKHLALAYK